jgi:hypothetical protein
MNINQRHFGIYLKMFIKNSMLMLKKKTTGKVELGDIIKALWFVYSRTVFDDNVIMINQHNLEADFGLHSYTLKVNQFADMVQQWIFYFLFQFFLFRLMKR